MGLHRAPNTGQVGFPQQASIKGNFIQLIKGGIKNGMKNYKREENIRMCSVLDSRWGQDCSQLFLKEKFLLDFSTQPSKVRRNLVRWSFRVCQVLPFKHRTEFHQIIKFGCFFCLTCDKRAFCPFWVRVSPISEGNLVIPGGLMSRWAADLEVLIQ